MLSTPAQGPRKPQEAPVSIIQHEPITTAPTGPIPAAAACPPWCTQHDAMLDSDDSTLVIHRATVDVAGYHVARAWACSSRSTAP